MSLLATAVEVPREGLSQWVLYTPYLGILLTGHWEESPINYFTSIEVYNDPAISNIHGVIINNTLIGEIQRNALRFSGKGMTVTVENSRLGILRQSGLDVKGGIRFAVSNSSFDLEDETSITLDETVDLSMISNKMIIPENFLELRNCEENVIERNRFILVKQSHPPMSLENENNVENDAENIRPENVSINHVISPKNFLHPSCMMQNTILNLSPEEESNDKVNLPIIATTTIIPKENVIDDEYVKGVATTEEPQGISTYIPNEFLHFDPERQFAVHKVFAYFLVGLLSTLIIIIIVLACLLACTRKKSSDALNVTTNNDRDRRPSLMYMPGSLYGNDAWPVSDPMPSTNSIFLKDFDDSGNA